MLQFKGHNCPSVAFQKSVEMMEGWRHIPIGVFIFAGVGKGSELEELIDKDIAYYLKQELWILMMYAGISLSLLIKL